MIVLACTALYGTVLTAAFQCYLILGRKNPTLNTVYLVSLFWLIVNIRQKTMERKDNGAKATGFCHRLFQFVMKNFPLYTQNPFKKIKQQEVKPSVRDGFNGVAERDEEDEVALVPPLITIPVEHREAMEKASVTEDKLEDKTKKKTIRIKSGLQEEGENALKMQEKVDKLNNKELKTLSSGKQPSKLRNEGEDSDVRPIKPVVRSVSNIDKRFDAFIRERKESFDL